MFMALAIGFGVKALGGILGGISKNKQIKAQNKATYLQNQRMLLQAGQQANQAYAQMGALSSQATGLQAEAQRQARLQGGQQDTLAAASGTIGASVDAVQNDIEHQSDVQRAQLATDLDTQLSNLRSQADSAFSSAVNNLGAGQKTQSMGSIIGKSVLSAGVDTGLNYLGARMQFGASGAASKAPVQGSTTSSSFGQSFTPATTIPFRSNNNLVKLSNL